METIERKTKSRLPVIEQIRAEVRKLDYTPLTDNGLADMRREMEDAIQNNAIEGQIREPAEVALDDMLLEERAPIAVQEYASRRYVEITVMKGKSLKGRMFRECPY